MRKTILTFLAASLLAVSSVQLAAAAERHYARKAAPSNSATPTTPSHGRPSRTGFPSIPKAT
jgi:hypothetical protein